MRTAFYQLMFLGLSLSSCTAQEVATSETLEAETTKPNVEIFRCLADNGAYHPLITIEREEADTDSAEDRDDDHPIRILFSAKDTGLLGTCDANDKNNATQKAKFTCKSSDQSIRLTWPSAAAKASATVIVEEKWLFGVRRYSTTCQPKG